MTEEEKAAKAAQEGGITGQVDTLLKGFFNDQLPGVVKEEVKSAMAELVENQKALAAANTETKTEELDQMKDWQQAAKFYSDVYKGDTSEWVSKGLTEGTDSEGGFLVPEVIWNQVSRIAENFGVVRTLSRKIIMTSDTFNVPTVESSVTTFWVDEEQNITESNPVFGNRKLRARTQGGISTASNQLLQDANQSIVDLLNRLFAEALAGGEDEQGINGVGAPFTGVMNDTDVPSEVMSAGNTAFSNVTYKNLLDMQGNLKDSVVRDGVYLMHRTVWNLILSIQEGSQTAYAFQNNGMPLATNGVRQSGITPVGVLHSKPVYVSDKMPATSASAISTAFVLFGNWEMGMAFGDRQQMTILTSMHATVGGNSMFQQNKQAIRVTARVAIQVIQPTAFVKLVTAAA